MLFWFYLLLISFLFLFRIKKKKNLTVFQNSSSFADLIHKCVWSFHKGSAHFLYIVPIFIHLTIVLRYLPSAVFSIFKSTRSYNEKNSWAAFMVLWIFFFLAQWNSLKTEPIFSHSLFQSAFLAWVTVIK